MIRKTFVPCLVLLLAGAAHAAPIVSTPPIPGGISGATQAICQIVNTGTKGANATVEIMSMDLPGTVLATNSAFVSAGAQSTAVLPGSAGSSKFCRVTGLSKSKVRVSFMELNGATILMTVTAP